MTAPIPPTESQITLRALEGAPLEDPRIREMVIATARAIAERQGVTVMDMSTDSDRITVKLNTGRIESIGFAAELRRLTNRWYTQKFGERTLWGESEEDRSESWKAR
jgi:hypothetical protein